jgi:type VI secretion system protein ImpJ
MAEPTKDAGAQGLSVVWQEGMLLSPQHFQQMERANHLRLSQRFRFSEPFGHGLRTFLLDEQALLHGRFSLIRASGVFPDGTSFDTEAGDPLPMPRDISKWFDAQHDKLLISLGLPLQRRGQPLAAPVAGDAIPGPRYTTQNAVLADDLVEGVDRELALARRNLVLLLPDEALSQHDVLPLGEVIRSTTGFAMRDPFDGAADPYIPPVVALDGSRSLHGKVRRMLNLLLDRSRELGDARTKRGSVAEFGRSDTVYFWQLHSVNTYIPLLRHFVENPQVHPEPVFLALATLAGELCTVNTQISARELPLYEHGALGGCFGQLCRILEQLLKETVPIRGKRVDLVSKPGPIHVGALNEPKLFDPRSRLFLGVSHAEMERQQVQATFAHRAIVASEQTVLALMAAALPGLRLLPPEQVPAGTPSHGVGWDYFELDRQHDLWRDITSARDVAVYLPPEFAGAKLDLVGNWD